MAERNLWLYFSDLQRACQMVSGFVAGKSLDNYLSDPFLRSAVERQLTIIGEATRAIVDIDPAYRAQMPEAGRIIALRNILVYRYFRVEHDVVWVIVTQRVPELLAVVNELLASEPLDERT